jgi:AcrR family transcriptional regulator
MAQPMRERILDAAIQVIKERGVTAATTKEIARTAEVSEGSLYNHFDNKSALFGSALAQVASGIRGAMMELLSAIGKNTVEDNLTRLAAAAVRFYGDLLPMTGSALGDREVLSWLQRGGPAQGHGPGESPGSFRPDAVPDDGAVTASGPTGPSLSQAGPVQGHARLITYLEAEQAAGRLTPETRPPYLAAALLGACQQHAFLTLLTGAQVVSAGAQLPPDPDDYARGLVRTILVGHLP